MFLKGKLSDSAMNQIHDSSAHRFIVAVVWGELIDFLASVKQFLGLTKYLLTNRIIKIMS